MPVLTYHGETDDAGRETFLASINSSDLTYSVGIMTFRAGGIGISITTPNHVIITNPGYNPTPTEQAIGRAHRWNQKKPVYVYRLVAAETIEESMLKLNLFKMAQSHALIDNLCVNGEDGVPVFARTEFCDEMLYLIFTDIKETIRRIQAHAGIISTPGNALPKASVQV